MQILTVNTGNNKLDDAYRRMQVHISTFKSVEEFENYFNSILKDNDPEVLKKWLMKVLFWEFKYGRDEKLKDSGIFADFRKMYEGVDDSKKLTIDKWVKSNLEKLKKPL